MTFIEKAARTVREFIRTATPEEVVALAKKASPELFPVAPTPASEPPAGAKARTRNGKNGPRR